VKVNEANAIKLSLMLCRGLLTTFSCFYSESALLSMARAVLARAMLSVRHSVTFQYCVQTNEDTIVWFSASGRTILLVSEEVKFIWIRRGSPL